MKAKVEIIGGAMDGIEMVISKTAFIGRDKNCEISIPVDRYISKKHAMLRLWSEGYILEDLGSTNGTYVNEEPVVKPVLLTNGQTFKVGRTLLKISYD
jgi:pSer/pThr/pTyr-binding forkhead associated (FHA) protein